MLRTAFEPGAGAGPQERRALCAVTLALLTRLFRTNPLLVAVDDAQDWDNASLDVLLSVRRQLTDQAVTMVFTAHGEGPLSGFPADLPVLRLGPLLPGAAARLLDAQPDAPRGRLRPDLLRQAEGNPLAIVDLHRASRLGAGSASVLQVFAARLDVLPEDTQRALLYFGRRPWASHRRSAHRREMGLPSVR
ncbi:hypothetical protein ACFXPY_17125 [Streptomyces sp. NPDC059153]|uniref:hypothetical protein n=1 Tax=Streptomyces sp. NPDC059153 TaxID=3346743 RepID=UPI0036AC0465